MAPKTFPVLSQMHYYESTGSPLIIFVPDKIALAANITVPSASTSILDILNSTWPLLCRQHAKTCRDFVRFLDLHRYAAYTFSKKKLPHNDQTG